MEDVFKTLIRKKEGSDNNFDVIVNDEKGDVEIFRSRRYKTNSSTNKILITKPHAGGAANVSRQGIWQVSI